MITIRQSCIGAYETCPFLFSEQYKPFGQEPEYNDDEAPTNKYALTGIKFHEVMECWGNSAMNNVRMSNKDMHTLLDCKLAEIPSMHYDNEIDEMAFKDSLHEQLDWIYDTHCDIKPLAVEHNFLIEDLIAGLPPFTGTIDCIEGNIEHKDVDIIDYKTGKVYTRLEMKSNVQATIYSLYFFKKYGFFPKNFVFYFTKHKKRKEIPITMEFMENGMDRIQNVWAHIVNNDFNAPMNPNKWFCKNACQSTKCKYKQKWGSVGFEVHNYRQNLIPGRNE